MKKIVSCALLATTLVTFNPGITLAVSPLTRMPSKSGQEIHKEFHTKSNRAKREEDVKRSLSEFIIRYHPNASGAYVNKVVCSYIKVGAALEKDVKKDPFLFYIALCSVESNFKMETISSSGAIGISQVMYSVHKKFIRELGFNYRNFRTSPYHNIYVGYLIWRSYLKNSSYSYREACYKYLGTSNSEYYNKIRRRHRELLSLI